MEKCAQCGAPATALKKTKLPTHEEIVLDLPVILLNAVERVSYDCGHYHDTIPNYEGMIAAVALCRVLMHYKLNGREIRLLRNTMGLKGIEFAKKLSVSAEAVSRWENGEPIGNAAEKLLRVTAALALMEKAPAIDVDLQQLTTMEISPIRPSNWSPLYLEQIRMKAVSGKFWDAELKAA